MIDDEGDVVAGSTRQRVKQRGGGVVQSVTWGVCLRVSEREGDPGWAEWAGLAVGLDR